MEQQHLTGSEVQRYPSGYAREGLNELATNLERRIPVDHSVVMPIVAGYTDENAAPHRLPRRT